MDLDNLVTESRNAAAERLDEMTAIQIARLLNTEDLLVAPAIASQLEVIARAIDAVADRFQHGGRLFYVGAGTSGRLGVLDASECPPTFQTPPEQVIGVIAGGRDALVRAVEGAEDVPEDGGRDLRAYQLTANDIVVGIATSGRTPYVLGAVQAARAAGTLTIGISCNPGSPLESAVDIPIVILVGPEVINGSTRLKAGTATKLVLNMLTTGAMVRIGKTYGDLMVDLKASNEKLRARSNRIVRIATGLDADAAATLLRSCGGEVKTAIIVHQAKLSVYQARQRLAEAGGNVRFALSGVNSTAPAVSWSDLVIGIDGGGSHTVALVAERKSGVILGRGISGPSNIQAVGAGKAIAALDEAVGRAFADAKRPRGKVAAAALGMAGVDHSQAAAIVKDWADRAQLADSVRIGNDAILLLAAGTPEGWGLAVIAGTGSIALARHADGRLDRSGGWGYLIGDEGSAYGLALAAVKAVARHHDGCSPETALTQRILSAMSLSEPLQIIEAVYRSGWERSRLATLAPLVLAAAAEGDPVAQSIAETEAGSLAKTAAAAARKLDLPLERLPLAMTGGTLSDAEYRRWFLAALRSNGVNAAPVTIVDEPATGAVRMACELATARK
jgi:N-acetylmuramic acid 6-phosphate etherase